MKKKLSIGLISLTSCEGCYFAILEDLQQYLAMNKKVAVKNFRLFEESEHPQNEKFDIAFVEGSPLTAQNMQSLKMIRKNSKILIAVGSCAHIGGIYHMKNYQDKKKIFEHIYNGVSGIDNFDVQPLDEIVSVDFVLPGCPVSASEFFTAVYSLVLGKKPKIIERPVCYECQINGYECVLQKGEKCLGPITVAGCDAVCLKSRQGCWGCRGVLPEAEEANLLKKLKEKFSEKEIVGLLEVFGVKEGR